MPRGKRWWLTSILAIAMLVAFAACEDGEEEEVTPSPGVTPAETPVDTPVLSGDLEVFSWWTTGGEAAGLENLFNLYPTACSPDVEIINATVAGGAGFNAKQVLKTRMLGGDPPDSFQVHMGHELIDTWVTTDFMEPLDFLYEEEGFNEVFPPGVLDIVSHEGSPYSVPVNIHRANVLWYNKQIFEDNNLQPPATFDDFFQVAETLQDAGITPLALGDVGIWASVHLMETVLLGSLGPDAYNGLWTGETDWNSAAVTQALENFERVLGFVNSDHAALTWDQANDLVLNGDAAMTIMGDWVDADNLAKGKSDLEGWAPTPGTAGNFQALSDTFGLPQNAPNRDAVECWLALLGSKEGQEAFNPVKGSICARNDCDASLFGPYLQSAMEDWQRDDIVPSLAHGAAASEGWVTDINDAVTAFVTDLDVPQFQSRLANACVNADVCT